MANQIIIDIGAVANDGTGDPLRTAFNYVNDNFSNVWTTGLPNSNVSFSDNRILTVNTNANLVLAPNGVGKIQANVDVIPNANLTLNLGSLTRQWNTVYSRNLEISGDTTFTGDVTIGGNLTVEGDTIQIGNITTDTKTIQLANTASTANAANGSGVTVGANDDIATLLYNSSTNTWNTNIGISSVGNVTAPYFIGNGSLLTGITSYANANAVAYGQSGWAGNIVPAGNSVYSLGNATNRWANLWLSGNTIQLGDLSLSASANGLTSTSGFDLENSTAANIEATGNITANNVIATEWVYGNLGVATQQVQFNDPFGFNANTAGLSFVDNDIVYEGQVPSGIRPSNPDMYNLGNVGYAWNEVHANVFYGNGSQLTGLSFTSISNDGSIVDIVVPNGDVTITANSTQTWSFDTNGDLTVPNYVQFAGNTIIGDEPGAGTPYFRIDTPLGYPATITTDADISGNNWSWTFGADGNLTLPTNKSIIVDGGDGVIGPVSDDMVISWDNEEIRLVSVQGSIEMQADNAFRVQTNYDGGTDTYLSRWEFGSDEIVNITGPSAIVTEAGNLTLSGGRNGLASGNVSVVAVNNGVSVSTWNFANDGSLTAPGNITTTANVSGGYILGNAAFMTGLPASYGNANVADFLDSLGSNAIVTTGNISGGNLLVTNATMTGNLIVNTSIGSQGATDLWLLPATNTTRSYGDINPFFANTYSLGGSTTRWNNVFANVANVVTLNTVGNVTGGNLITGGQVSATGSLSGQNLVLTASAANEGGEIQLALPSSGTTLTGNIIIDSYQNSIRLFEGGGNTRGLYVDVPNVSASGQYAIGYRDVPQIALSANVTADGLSAGKHFYSTTAGNLQVTIPDNANVAFPTGAAITIVVNAAGNVVVAQGTGVSLYMAGSSSTGNRTVGAYGLASVMKVATDTWVISGTGVY